jgi:hypothetical protein
LLLARNNDRFIDLCDIGTVLLAWVRRRSWRTGYGG